MGSARTIRRVGLALALSLSASAAHAAAKRVRLDVEATTWRENRRPYDIRAAIVKKLTAANVAVVAKGPTDGSIAIVYEESVGPGYSATVGGEATRTGTDFGFD